MAQVIIKPIITEKMTQLGEKLHRYAFIVDKSANKIEVKNAVKQLYGVDVTDVNTMNFIGKKVSRYTKKNFTVGRKRAFKKAVVTLKEGQEIDFFNNI